MALPSKYGIDKKINSMEGLSAYENGGKGSGNWGHSGRPGEIGGSGKSSGGSNTKNIDDEIEKTKKEIKELGDFLGSVPPSGILSSEMDNIDEVSKELEKARKKLEKLEKEKKAEIKGGTKTEREAFKKLGEDYYSGDDRGFQGILEDARAAGLPDDTNYQKGERLVDGGSFATSSYDAYKDLKSIYGDNFKESTYVKKGGSAENGDWLMSGSDTYVWKTYRAKMAKMIADELDKKN